MRYLALTDRTDHVRKPWALEYEGMFGLFDALEQRLACELTPASCQVVMNPLRAVYNRLLEQLTERELAESSIASTVLVNYHSGEGKTTPEYRDHFRRKGMDAAYQAFNQFLESESDRLLDQTSFFQRLLKQAYQDASQQLFETVAPITQEQKSACISEAGDTLRWEVRGRVLDEELIGSMLSQVLTSTSFKSFDGASKTDVNLNIGFATPFIIEKIKPCLAMTSAIFAQCESELLSGMYKQPAEDNTPFVRDRYRKQAVQVIGATLIRSIVKIIDVLFQEIEKKIPAFMSVFNSLEARDARSLFREKIKMSFRERIEAAQQETLKNILEQQPSRALVVMGSRELVRFSVFAERRAVSADARLLEDAGNKVNELEF